MYVQQENLSQFGSSAVEIPSTNAKKTNLLGSCTDVLLCVKKKSNLTAHPEFETIQSDDATI